MVYRMLRVIEYVGIKAAVERCVAQSRVTSTPFLEIPGVAITEIATTPLLEITADGNNDHPQFFHPTEPFPSADGTTYINVIPPTPVGAPSGSERSGEDVKYSDPFESRD